MNILCFGRQSYPSRRMVDSTTNKNYKIISERINIEGMFWWWCLRALSDMLIQILFKERCSTGLRSLKAIAFVLILRQPCLWIHQLCFGRDDFPNVLTPMWSWSRSDRLRLIKQQTAALLLHQLWLLRDCLKTPTVLNICVCLFLLCVVCVCACRCRVGMLLLCTSKRETGMEGERGGGEKMKAKKQEENSSIQCWIYRKMKDFRAVNLLE